MTVDLRKLLAAALWVILATSLYVGLSVRYGQVPALGPLLSPFEGCWRHAEPVVTATPGNVPVLARLPGLERPALVRFDSSLIPHIEALSQGDVYYLQGYHAAQLRLWQMDFITRVAAGRLAEVFGSVALGFDRAQRGLGMTYAAERALDTMMAHPDTRMMLTRYADGVNDYLAGLDTRDYPLEYKILGYEPERWTPLHSALLLKYMAYNLTTRADDVAQTRLRHLLGKETTEQIFPWPRPEEQPIRPAGLRLDFTPLPSRRADDTVPLLDDPLMSLFPTDWGLVGDDEAKSIKGSNNWAVGSRSTSTGVALLANDPHLALTAPGIWLQMQLTCPGMAVMGATLPGAPGVIIGYNKAIAWGVTNAYADVFDLYQVTRTGQGDSYLSPDGPRPLRPRVETIAIRGGETQTDTIWYTDIGPVPYWAPGGGRPGPDVHHGLAVRWAAHDGSNEVRAFAGLNRARSYKEYVASLAHMGSPAQNFAFADVTGQVALWSAGAYPHRWPGQGRYVMFAERPFQAWGSKLPHQHSPHQITPPSGFVASANQSLTATDYPYYFDWRYSPPGRALRINRRLVSMGGMATPDSMRALQLDDVNWTAWQTTSRMLSLVRWEELTGPQQEGRQILQSWDYRMDSLSIGASLYNAWWRALSDTLWDELRRPGLMTPDEDLTASLLLAEDPHWVDVSRTPEQETWGDIVQAAYLRAFDELTQRQGAAGRQWAWGRVKRTRIAHLGRIPGLGHDFVSCSGAPGVVNATGSTHGASLRIVVELTPGGPRGWAIVPGGQSGNPGSPHYDDQLEEWRQGRLRPLAWYGPGSTSFVGLKTVIHYRP